MKKLQKFVLVSAIIVVGMIAMTACSTTYDMFSAEKIKTVYISSDINIKDSNFNNYQSLNINTLLNSDTNHTIDKIFEISDGTIAALVVVFNVPTIPSDIKNILQGSGLLYGKDNVIICQYNIDGTLCAAPNYGLYDPEITAINQPLANAKSDSKYKV